MANKHTFPYSQGDFTNGKVCPTKQQQQQRVCVCVLVHRVLSLHRLNFRNWRRQSGVAKQPTSAPLLCTMKEKEKKSKIQRKSRSAKGLLNRMKSNSSPLLSTQCNLYCESLMQLKRSEFKNGESIRYVIRKN